LQCPKEGRTTLLAATWTEFPPRNPSLTGGRKLRGEKWEHCEEEEPPHFGDLEEARLWWSCLEEDQTRFYSQVARPTPRSAFFVFAGYSVSFFTNLPLFIFFSLFISSYIASAVLPLFSSPKALIPLGFFIPIHSDPNYSSITCTTTTI